jgi:hypothetical protein
VITGPPGAGVILVLRMQAERVRMWLKEVLVLCAVNQHPRVVRLHGVVTERYGLLLPAGQTGGPDGRFRWMELQAFGRRADDGL